MVQWNDIELALLRDTLKHNPYPSSEEVTSLAILLDRPVKDVRRFFTDWKGTERVQDAMIAVALQKVTPALSCDQVCECSVAVRCENDDASIGKMLWGEIEREASIIKDATMTMDDAIAIAGSAYLLRVARALKK